MAKEGIKKEDGLSRREFLKLSGAVAAAVQVGAVAGAGLSASKDPSTLTGWQHQGDNTQFVDRKPLEIEGPAYEIVGPIRRPEEMESAFGRSDHLRKDMMSSRQPGTPPPGEKSEDKKPEVGQGGPPEGTGDSAPPPPKKESRPPGSPSMKMPPLSAITDPLASYYKEHPDIYELDKVRLESILPKRRQDMAKYGRYYTLINAWSSAWMTSERITDPPEVSDFEIGGRGGGEKLRDLIPFKSPALASELIKKVTHHFGASMVGIAKLNPSWCYNHGLRGSHDKGPYEVPKHWEYVIAFGIPHQWEQVQSNPNAGSSFDAYSRVTVAARRLENYIKLLGYPARRHSPLDGYDVIAVPILVDTGLGQQGRHGIVITPETGSNFRVAFVTTNLPMEIDKPIDFGVDEFCTHCKICAEICPSGSISFEQTNQDMTSRGHRHWEINQTSCFNYWMQSMGGMGCRLCLIACPYSRKNNWAHALAREVDSHDPTGVATKSLTWMQKTFFDAPGAAEYLPPPDGRFATFRDPPDWLQVEKYLDLDVIDPTQGG